jgi:RNA polymerase sigma-70 factor (ECF subfamily)
LSLGIVVEVLAMVKMTARPPRSASYRGILDEELMERLSRRDAAALEVLYERYGNLVYSIARRILGDDHLAEDVSQEVFLRIWRQPEQYVAAKGRFVTWLLSITHNRAVDLLRTRGRRCRLEATLPDQQERELRDDNAGDPALSAELSEQRRAVLAAMTALSPQQRQVIALAYCGGLTQREMAQRLGQPLGTVKTRVRGAMQTLRRALQANDEPSEKVLKKEVLLGNSL